MINTMNNNMRINKFIIYFKPYKEKKKGNEDIAIYSKEFLRLYENIDMINMNITATTMNV